MQTQTAGNGKTFLAMDPELPLLCARAAVELDRLLLKEPTELSSVRALANLLSTVPLPAATTASTQHRCLNPSTSFVIKNALLESREVKSLRNMTVTSFSRKTEKISKALQDLGSKAGNQPTPTKNSKELKKLIRFCVALSNVSAAYQEAILGPEE